MGLLMFWLSSSDNHTPRSFSTPNHRNTTHKTQQCSVIQPEPPWALSLEGNQLDATETSGERVKEQEMNQPLL